MPEGKKTYIQAERCQALSFSPQQYSEKERLPVPDKRLLATANIQCPQHILVAFQKLVSNTTLLGATIQYSKETYITLPDQASDFTPYHLQILARNELYNTDGKQKDALYQGHLDHKQIGTLRILAKYTTLSALTYAYATGGYPEKSSRQLICSADEFSREKMILVDQAGLQWQNDLQNSGFMFFSLNDNNSHTIWANSLYYDIRTAAEPMSSVLVSAIWTPTTNDKGYLETEVHSGTLDLTKISAAISQEFKQALSAVRIQEKNLQSTDKILFRYLKAGMGYFCSSIHLTEQPAALENARLQGILDALKTLSRESLGQVKKLELPFSDSKDEKARSLLYAINYRAEQLGLGIVETGQIDALQPAKGYIIATTNCADPHAQIGNEGNFESVDAMIAGNAYTTHLNTYENPVLAKTENHTITTGFFEEKTAFSISREDAVVKGSSPILPAIAEAYKEIDALLGTIDTNSPELLTEEIIKQAQDILVELTKRYRAASDTSSNPKDKQVADQKLQQVQKVLLDLTATQRASGRANQKGRISASTLHSILLPLQGKTIEEFINPKTSSSADNAPSQYYAAPQETRSLSTKEEALENVTITLEKLKKRYQKAYETNKESSCSYRRRDSEDAKLKAVAVDNTLSALSKLAREPRQDITNKMRVLLNALSDNINFKKRRADKALFQKMEKSGLSILETTLAKFEGNGTSEPFLGYTDIKKTLENLKMRYKKAYETNKESSFSYRRRDSQVAENKAKAVGETLVELEKLASSPPRDITNVTGILLQKLSSNPMFKKRRADKALFQKMEKSGISILKTAIAKFEEKKQKTSGKFKR